MHHSLANESFQCHDCSLPVTVPALQHRQKAHCPRCGMQLTRYYRDAIDHVLAYAISALIFLAASVPFDFLSFSARGQAQTVDIPTSVLTLIENDFMLLAIIQILAIFIVPMIILFGLLYLLVPLRINRKAPSGSAVVFKFVFALIPWGMAEIFLIGALVSLIKISSLADVGLGFSFYAYIGFALCMVLTLNYMDKFELQQKLKLPRHTASPGRKSSQQCWALLATAVVLYIPASTLPIMTTRLLGQDEPSTIMGGVLVLWEHGSYPIAVIIFFASVFIPIVKMLVLAWLNYSVQTRRVSLHKQRILLYRIIEFVGRWSMIDVFVVAVLVSLIQLGNTMSIYPGPAALAFSGVVVLTMLAAMAFDSHLIWHPDKHD